MIERYQIYTNNDYRQISFTFITFLGDFATPLCTILLMHPFRAINQVTRKSTEPLMSENTGVLSGYRCLYINTLAGGHARLLTIAG